MDQGTCWGWNGSGYMLGLEWIRVHVEREWIRVHVEREWIRVHVGVGMDQGMCWEDEMLLK